MKTYNGWDLLETMPYGWRIDVTAGSPLPGYSFVSDGKSILRGGRRALLLVRPRQIALNLPAPTVEAVRLPTPEERKAADPGCPRTVNELARKLFELRLLADIRMDMMICGIEGWSQSEYLAELRELINGIGRDANLTANAAAAAGTATPVAARWYVLTNDGMATLCADEADAKELAADADVSYPRMAPHRAVQLVPASQLAAAVAKERERIADLAADLAADACVDYANGSPVNFRKMVGDAIRAGDAKEGKG